MSSGDAVTEPVGGGGSAARRCPECAVELRAGVKYCDFCGMKVAEEVVVAAAAGRQARGTRVVMLKGIAVGCLAIGVLVYFGNRLRDRESPPAPPPGALEDKRQAAAVCEAAIREQVRSPFRVIAFRSTLVAEKQGGYAVSGAVELQSAAGDLQRKRYSCRVHADARAGMVLDEGRMD